MNTGALVVFAGWRALSARPRITASFPTNRWWDRIWIIFRAMGPDEESILRSAANGSEEDKWATATAKTRSDADTQRRGKDIREYLAALSTMADKRIRFIRLSRLALHRGDLGTGGGYLARRACGSSGARYWRWRSACCSWRGALEVWRGARMLGLPDIGHPFDVAAFRAFRVAESEDAFVLLKQAQAKLLGQRRIFPSLSEGTVRIVGPGERPGAPRLAGCAP